jgi:hypothetical protein
VWYTGNDEEDRDKWTCSFITQVYGAWLNGDDQEYDRLHGDLINFYGTWTLGAWPMRASKRQPVFFLLTLTGCCTILPHLQSRGGRWRSRTSKI